MTDLQRAVLNCFHSVFPALSETELTRMRQSEHAAWDSVAHVTLVALLHEALDIELDVDDLEDMTSFDAACAIAERHLASP
jgi:acyl carrier protein